MTPETTARISRSLSLIPRWAGNVTREFYVSDHLLIGLAWLQYQGAPVEVQRAWLMHDAVEAWTSDVPTPYKTDDFKSQENDLLLDMAMKIGVSFDALYSPTVKQCDLEMAAAEDSVIHYSPCGTYGRAPDHLVYMIEHRPRQTWEERQSEFSRVWGEMFSEVAA